MASEQIEGVESQINTERRAAAKVARYENDNQSMTQELVRTQKPVELSEDRVARTLHGTSKSPQLVELSKPRAAF